MKRLILFVLFLLCVPLAKADVGQAVLDFATTNSGVGIEAFRGVSENKYILALSYEKDITTNAGVLMTWDRCFTPHNSIEPQSDQLTGGFQLKTGVYPLRRWNPESEFKLDVGGYDEAGVVSSGQNNGAAVNVFGAYIGYETGAFQFALLYQNRVESDHFAGNYVGFHAGFRF